MTRLALLLLSVSVLVVIGIFSGWFFRGFSPAELEQLDRDWEQVVTWANLPEQDLEREARMARLAEEVQAVELPDLFDRQEGEWVAREELSPQVSAVLLEFEDLLADEALGGVPGEMQVFPFMQLGTLELAMGDLTSERMGHLLRWSRQLHREGPLIGLMVGVALGEKALARCQLEPDLIPAFADVEAPTVEEYFSALCRDYVFTDRLLTTGSLEGGMLPTPAGDEFATQALRRAMASNARRFHPQRSDPEGYAKQPEVEMPGPVELWLASIFGQEETYTIYLESFFSAHGAQRHWLDFVESWNEVLGA